MNAHEGLLADFGEALRGARPSHVSQAEIAKVLGVGRTSVTGWEGGRFLPTLPHLYKAALYLDLQDEILEDLVSKWTRAKIAQAVGGTLVQIRREVQS